MIISNKICNFKNIIFLKFELLLLLLIIKKKIFNY